MLQKTQTRVSGYELHDLGSHWEFRSSSGVFRGDLKQVIVYAVINHEFTIKELELGVMEMEKHFHDYAQYGIFKTFMWSGDSERTKNVG